MENTRGLYRVPPVGGIPAAIWVRGADGVEFKVSEERYRLNKYTPKIEELPTKDEYKPNDNA